MQDEENGSAPSAGEAEAWAEVRAAWGDDARHRAYLARFVSLDDLAVAGRRYREALADRPEDPVALRWRDEVVRRAVAAGLASVPHEPARARRLRWLWPAVALALAALGGWLLFAQSAHVPGVRP
jgi:hypothetical protein